MTVELAFTPSGHLTAVESTAELPAGSPDASSDGRMKRLVKAFATSQAEGLFALASERFEAPWRRPWPIGAIWPHGT